jgi:predicted MFS family arabinose efflux permease
MIQTSWRGADLPLLIRDKALVNWQLARYLTGTGLATFADRLAQVQLLSTVVMSGPDGQGLGSNTLSLVLPFVLFSYAIGSVVDRTNNRKLLITVTVARALLVLSIPTILTSLGATGPIIPLCISTLCACIAFSTITNFGVIPRLVTAHTQLRSANAASLLTAATATLFAVSISPFLAEIWLPHETLRFASVLYFIAMFFFWTIDNTRTKTISAAADDIKEVAKALHENNGVISIFRLALFAHIGHGLFYCMFLVFCLQNTQLNNAQSFNIFATIALGFLAGAVASMTWIKQIKASSTIGFSTMAAAIACLLFSILGSNATWMRIFLLIMGTTGATALIAIDLLLQRQFDHKVRAKIYGAIVCLSAAAYTIAIVGVEQIATRYSALTILRGIAVGWLSYAFLVALSSKKLKNQLLKAQSDTTTTKSAKAIRSPIKK